MDLPRIFSLKGLPTSTLLSSMVLNFIIVFFSPSIFPASNPFSNDQAKKYETYTATPLSFIPFDTKKQKLDASTQILMNTSSRRRVSFLSKKSHLSVNKDASGRMLIDLFIQIKDPAALSSLLALDIEIRTQVGDISVARAPVEVLGALAEVPGVQRVEISQKRPAALDSSRTSISADKVHQGIDLPQAYRGENVVVGVIDSGIDFNHPDFNDENGSRIQYLLEFIEGSGQNEWTKNIIDNNPASVTQRDGDGGGGHGTHVTGIAAGGGQLNSAMTGIAPASDIIFVKGVRDPDSNGGYVDTDVIAGCQYIFNKADQMGKPAVINLSIGSHSGPHDGSSLYEQSLSGLAGPGKLIVAAAGNEGDDFIHAGNNAVANIGNETILIADSLDQFAAVDLWYDSGTISHLFVFAYDEQFNFLGQTASLSVGTFMNSTPLVVNNDTLGFVVIDAQTTQDPNNGDGNAIFIIDNDDNPTIDISEVLWGIGSIGDSNGRLDMWVIRGGRFYDQVVGFPNETEMPGNNDYSVGPPSTAEKVIAVGSYVTKNSWVDVDDRLLMLSPPPVILDRSAFSSKGPTRDGRMSPDITAPGQLIFAALSSHLTEGIGYDRYAVLQGGGYLGKNGTSQATPHVTGTIALLLQIKNDLTYNEAIQGFSETARTNQFTGSTPNNSVGPGYLDAHGAVENMVGLVSSVENRDEAHPHSFVLKQNYPNPFNSTTNIIFDLPERSRVKIEIYDILGQLVDIITEKDFPAGSHIVKYDGSALNSGIFYYRIVTKYFTGTKKMLYVK
jgi:minor extracellular serine protease Vpr